MTLTKDNMSRYLDPKGDNLYSDKPEDFLDIDEKAISCLQRDYGVTMNQRAMSVSNLYARKTTNRPSSMQLPRPVRVLNSIPFKLLT